MTDRQLAMVRVIWETCLAPGSVFSTQIYQLLYSISTLGSIIAGAKLSWSIFDAQGVRTNLRRGWQALRESRHIYPIFGHAHKPSTNPDDENSKHTDPEGVHSSTCHPRCCFGFSLIADRKALKSGAMCRLRVKGVQKERSYLFALIDLIKFQKGAPIEYLTADCQSVRLPHTVDVREIVVRLVLKNLQTGIVGRLKVLFIKCNSRRLEFRLEESGRHDDKRVTELWPRNLNAREFRPGCSSI